jgi:hypothetical protein
MAAVLGGAAIGVLLPVGAIRSGVPNRRAHRRGLPLSPATRQFMLMFCARDILDFSCCQ